MYQRVVKRILDFIISIMAMPFILMILLIVTPLIYINDPGPIYYVSKRIGKNGIIFDMYKLRTMKVNSPDLRNSDGSTFNSDSDSRQTEIGRILRKLSIDELPQFFNILKGDMTLIGPRPVLDSQLASFSDEEKEKLKVLPGITGYSQAYCRLPRYLTKPRQRRSEWDMAGSDGISRVSAVFRGKSLLTNKMRII